MDLSYQEKSILGSLLAYVVVYGYYFAAVLRDASQSEFKVGRLVLAVIAIVVIQVVYHIALGLEKPEPKDERDILIECKANRNAYSALFAGAFAVIGHLAFDAAPTTPFVTANLVLFFMVLAELVKLLTQLFYYRWGVR